MDLEQIALSIFLPAIVSACVAIYNNKRQKHLEFSYDYRKYILDKRKLAYEKVEKVIGGFQMMHFDEGGVAPKFYDLGYSKTNPLAEFNNLVLDTLRNNIWLSTDLFFKLQELNEILLKQMKELKIHDDLREGMREVGVRDRERMVVFYGTLTNLYFKDIIELDNIKSFKSDKEFESLMRTQATNFLLAKNREG